MRAVDGKQEINLEWPNHRIRVDYLNFKVIITDLVSYPYAFYEELNYSLFGSYACAKTNREARYAQRFIVP